MKNTDDWRKAALFCSHSERCISEVESKLQQWGVPNDHIAPIIAYLLKEKYLDERRYAMAFVNDKFRFQQWGKLKMLFHLKIKKIEPEVIREALNSIDALAYESMIRKLSHAKSLKISYKSENEKNTKVIRYLASKGFETELVGLYLKTAHPNE